MLKFKNNTQKEIFDANTSFSERKIEELERPCKNQRLWKMSDRFLNVWNILFTGNVDEYCISYKPKFDGDDSFSVYIVTSGNNVEIYRAVKNGRNLQADRSLKQFINLALLVSCYIKFGYLK